MTKQNPEEADRWLYSKAVIKDMQQLARLMAANLPAAVIAERMGIKEKELAKVFKLLGVK